MNLVSEEQKQAITKAWSQLNLMLEKIFNKIISFISKAVKTIVNFFRTTVLSTAQMSGVKRLESLANIYRKTKNKRIKNKVMKILTREIILDRHGKWTKEAIWIHRNERGDIVRSQDFDPRGYSTLAEQLRVNNQKLTG